MGALFDWEHEVVTSNPDYYKWTQWLFLQLYKAGLAYRAKAPVDWCPSCKTVLANEQVINGKCERCDHEVVQKELEQWFFKITKYAEKLLKNLEKIDWSERTKLAQKNWIGRSEDTEIHFALKDSDAKIPVITTRADTIFGVTFLVLAPEHELVKKLKDKIENWKEVEKYIKQAQKKNEFDRVVGKKEKTGIELKGIIGINPVNDEEIPVWIADYVLATYGTGAIMSVPAHDERDFAFAKKYDLPIVHVIKKPQESGVCRVYIYDEDTSEVAQKIRDLGKPMEYETPTQRRYDIAIKEASRLIKLLKAERIGSKSEHKEIEKGEAFALEMKPAFLDFGIVYGGDGVHINSEFLNDLDTKEAIEKMVDWLKKRKLGGKSVHYHLRDWLISRQRYWGPPIPMIHCEQCGIVPVPEKDLPVELPYLKDFQPTGVDEESPLASVKSFVNVQCPKCKGDAKRETDVSDNFLDSAWYYIRYPSVGNDTNPFDKTLTKKWLPVNMYIGGQEHAVLHLMYARFVTMALKDMGYIDFDEPFDTFRAHGLVIKDGSKMSKSKGNVVNPDEYFKNYGADTVRMYLMFLGPFSQGGDWSDKGILGISRFLNRVWNFVDQGVLGWEKDSVRNRNFDTPQVMRALRHKTIKKITEDMENLHYNTAIAALMEYYNETVRTLSRPEFTTTHKERRYQFGKEATETLLVLMAPFAPHITEDLWQKLGHKDSVHNKPWLVYDEKFVAGDTGKVILQVNGKVRDVVEVDAWISKKEEEWKEFALQSEQIQKWLKRAEPQKIIVIWGKDEELVRKNLEGQKWSKGVEAENIIGGSPKLINIVI